MAASIALAEALGMDARATAELLPEIEAEMAEAINHRIGAQTDG